MSEKMEVSVIDYQTSLAKAHYNKVWELMDILINEPNLALVDRIAIQDKMAEHQLAHDECMKKLKSFCMMG